MGACSYEYSVFVHACESRIVAVRRWRCTQQYTVAFGSVDSKVCRCVRGADTAYKVHWRSTGNSRTAAAAQCCYGQRSDAVEVGRISGTSKCTSDKTRIELQRESAQMVGWFRYARRSVSADTSYIGGRMRKILITVLLGCAMYFGAGCMDTAKYNYAQD